MNIYMKEYQLNVDPRILELLGPNLYTNIYYVLAELVANAYDADAHNVYIISNKDDIRIEDDGHGMSYQNGEVKKFLNVAGVSRVKEEESMTRSGERRKMGRKGVGKLATSSYPLEPIAVDKNFRGKPEQNPQQCIGCAACGPSSE